MSSKNKQQSTGSQQITYGQIVPQDTEDIRRLRGQKFSVDPSIGFRVGGALRRLQNQMTSPTGGYATPQMRDAIMRSQERNLLESGSQAFREGQHDVNALDYGRNAMLAELTRPQVVQSGGTSSGTVTQSQPLLGSIIGGGASVGAAAL